MKTFKTTLVVFPFPFLATFILTPTWPKKSLHQIEHGAVPPTMYTVYKGD
jgi:hypothetical protein